LLELLFAEGEGGVVHRRVNELSAHWGLGKLVWQRPISVFLNRPVLGYRRRFLNEKRRHLVELVLRLLQLLF
jgi:hypothetical protein